jgi:hypothetical protein
MLVVKKNKKAREIKMRDRKEGHLIMGSKRSQRKTLI